MPSRSAEKTTRTQSRRGRGFGKGTDPSLRNIIAQCLVVIVLFAVGAYFVQNGITNLRKQGIASGLGFLDRSSGFSIIQHLIPYDERSTYGRAFVVAILNTFVVSMIGMVLATICGFALGIARISHHRLLARFSLIYIEVVRNIPLLLQLFFWYFGVLRSLPMPEASWEIGNVLFLNIRGLYLANPLTGELPHLGRFNIEGGLCLLPEFVALMLTLTTYTAAFVAEIVRSGLLAVPRGQWEAAAALGLSRGQVLRLVIMPQALRIIMPPLTSQWLNLTKNSSLGAAIGYPEMALVFAGTVLLQTGQAVEVMALTMGVYLLMSLSVAALSQIYQYRERQKSSGKTSQTTGGARP